MRLFEAIVDANHRAVAGDPSAGVRPADFTDELPVIALTCVDPRLNALFPNVLALPGDQFIWLRNAGNIITAPLSSTMRSLALACAIKGGKEIAIIGHTDCQVCKITTMQLLDRLKAQGVERHALPENLSEYFGMSGSERQNVLKSVDFARQSPLIGPNVPVHGFLVDVSTGKLEWLVNGYETWQKPSQPGSGLGGGDDSGLLKSLPKFEIGEMKFPDAKIGEVMGRPPDFPVAPQPPPIAPPAPPRPPGVPPAIRAHVRWNRPK
jgi:carbonic anhydrase